MLLGLSLAAPAHAQEAAPLNAIMSPSILSQMVMLDEPVSAPATAPAPAAEVTDALPSSVSRETDSPVVQSQAPVM
ncbi:MAG: hypothetical protein K2Q01_00075, partial [Rickettsiales bacterium]|nr:hypothetical protein [Rickettsiales bacterium]